MFRRPATSSSNPIVSGDLTVLDDVSIADDLAVGDDLAVTGDITAATVTATTVSATSGASVSSNTVSAAASSSLTLLGKAADGGNAVILKTNTALTSGNIVQCQQSNGDPYFNISFQGAATGLRFVDFSGAYFGGRGKIQDVPTGGAADITATITLVNGVGSHTTSAVNAASFVAVSLETPGGTLGVNYKVTKVAATSVTITAVAADGTTVTTDTSTLRFWIFN